MKQASGFTLRTLAFGIAASIAAVAIFVLALTAQYFRDAAFALQQQSIARVVEVAGLEALRHLEGRLFAQGMEFQARGAFRTAFAQSLATGDMAPLQPLLQDPFVHGFADMREVDLAKLRAYGPDLRLIDQNASGVAMPEGMAEALLQQAAGRLGADRLKAVSALWRHADRAYYSLLVPVGGLRLEGYLELVVDPVFNLHGVERLTAMPLEIRDLSDELLYQSADASSDDLLKIAYELRDGLGNPVLKLIAHADVQGFAAEQRNTLMTAILVVLMIVLVTTVLMWAFLNRILLRPVAVMQGEMKRCASGDLGVTVRGGVLREFDALANAFNEMTRKVSANMLELERLSHIDSLTGLANRHHFDLCIEKEWRRTLRSRTLVSLLIVDVDHFKAYNDHYGHVAGDECLRIVAGAIGRTVQRSTDLPARYGGEEFAVLLPDTPLDSAVVLAEALLDDLAALNLPHEAAPLGRVSVSIGVAVCGTADSCNPSGLVQAADEALYAAKHAGRNCLMVADAAANAGRCASCPGFVPRIQASV